MSLNTLSQGFWFSRHLYPGMALYRSSALLTLQNWTMSTILTWQNSCLKMLHLWCCSSGNVCCLMPNMPRWCAPCSELWYLCIIKLIVAQNGITIKVHLPWHGKLSSLMIYAATNLVLDMALLGIVLSVLNVLRLWVLHLLQYQVLPTICYCFWLLSILLFTNDTFVLRQAFN